MPRLGLLSLFVILCAGWSSKALATKHRYPMSTSGTYITAYYDTNRSRGSLKDWNGGKKTYDNHSGSDYGVGGFSGMDRGVTVVAGADGKVVAAVDGYGDRCTSGKCSPCNGNYVKIQHSNGTYSYYLHLRKGSVRVKVGQTVKCGQQLGQVGSSGCSTGPHLHFQVNGSSGSRDPFLNGDWVNRGSYLKHPSTTCQGGSTPPPNPTTCNHVLTRRLGTSNLNIRSGASTSNGIVGSVPNNKCLAVISKTTTGQSVFGDRTWYKITYAGKTGWISGYYAGCSNCGGVCSNGAKRACYTGSSSTRKKGVCRDGTQTCSGGNWGSCSGEVKPSSERCDGKDNDCDGRTDENNPGGGASCSTGKSGVCSAGTRQCSGGSLKCVPKTGAAPERCDGKDNDCDGSVDEGNPEGGGVCSNGKPGICGQGVWTCQSGRKVCVGGGSPSVEVCDGKDNNCNGTTDEGLSRSCYSGPANTNGRGVCKGGNQICSNGVWGSCVGQVLPSGSEICNNKQDDNCDGRVDENCGNTGGCKNNTTRTCYDGPPATSGAGKCRSGTQTCRNGSWGPCLNQILPSSSDLCGNGVDDDCDGKTDEDCNACTAGQTKPCYTGPNGSQNKGICRAGIQSCEGGKWSTCKGQVLPAQIEQCGNKKDDNCNGSVDEGCKQDGPCDDLDKDGYGIGSGCKGVQDCNDNDKTINPGASEICGNNKDDDCKGGDKACGKIGLGEEGCTKPSDCQDGLLCAKLDGQNRCTKGCSTRTDCPSGYTCVDGKACWPVTKKEVPQSDFVRPCKDDQDCKNGEYCDRGFCAEKRGGCACSATGEIPLEQGLWALLVLFALVWRRRLSVRS